jgi:nitroreductase
MTRDFDPTRPVPAAVLDRLVDLAVRAPSAGKTQGWHLVVLEGADTARFWDVTLPEERRPGFRWHGLLAAPIIALPLADPEAYVARYAEPDKAATGWGRGMDAWPAPYWTIDASMAVMTLLLAAEAEGLGSLFFAVSRDEERLRGNLGIPEHLQLLGAIALGWPAAGSAERGRSADRPRRPSAAVIHRGGW